MRRIAFIIFMVFAAGLLHGQLVQTSSYLGKQRPQKSNQNKASRNTLPFWEDFSTTNGIDPDAVRIWGSDTIFQWDLEKSKGVFVNNTLAINPPTYRVISFDGLDSSGQIYADGNGITDELYSKEMDLSDYSEADNIYISFFWQGGGNVEQPEEKDSIHLEFYNKDEKKWQWIWSKNGAEIPSTSIFYQEHFQLTEQLISDSTIFRFQAFGDQNGPFDAWHLDWIYINADRENDRYFYFDRGLTGQLTSPISPFKSMPIHQLKSDTSLVIGHQTLQAFNLLDSIQATEFVLTLKNSEDQTLIDSIVIEQVLNESTSTDAFSNTSNLDFSNIDLHAIPDVDSLVLESSVYLLESSDPFLNETEIDLTINDTVTTQYTFHDYYAFDDGSAEYAVGTNKQGDQVGVQYWVAEPDTLTQIDIYFPNINPDSNNEILVLKVFKSLENNQPIYTESITISTAKETNAFTSYELRRPVIVADTFYIAYEQNVNKYISLGLDRSNAEAGNYIFENVTGEWTRNERIKGALMFRPVFNTVTDFLLTTSSANSKPVIYPNPTNGQIQIVGEYTFIELRDLAGRLLLREEAGSDHDFSKIRKGIYLLAIFGGVQPTSQKIVIE